MEESSRGAAAAPPEGGLPALPTAHSFPTKVAEGPAGCIMCTLKGFTAVTVLGNHAENQI